MDTFSVTSDMIPTERFVVAGEYHLGPADSLVFINRDVTNPGQVDGIRLISTGESNPEINFSPEKYSDTIATGESIKFNIYAQSLNNSRRITALKFYAITNGTYHLIKAKNFAPADVYNDSLEYIVNELSGDFEISCVVFDETADSTIKSYSLHIDNSPPEIELGSESILSGNQGDTLVFNLLLYAASNSRPLKELRITKNPGGENVLLKTYSLSRLQEFINYHHPISTSDLSNLLLRFELTDNLNYSSKKDFTYSNTGTNNLPDSFCFHYNPQNQELHILNLNHHSNNKNLVLIYDTLGRLLLKKELMQEMEYSFNLNSLNKGVLLIKYISNNKTKVYRFYKE